MENIDEIELWDNNPYSTGTIMQLPDGSLMLERTPIVHKELPNDQYYRIHEGDTIWSIAFQAYGESKYQWLLADANKIQNPFELEIGTLILVPELALLNIQDE